MTAEAARPRGHEGRIDGGGFNIGGFNSKLSCDCIGQLSGVIAL